MHGPAAETILRLNLERFSFGHKAAVGEGPDRVSLVRLRIDYIRRVVQSLTSRHSRGSLETRR